MKYLFTAIVALLAYSCDSENNDVVNTVDKEGSIETQVKTEHVNDSADVLITSHKVYKNGALLNTIVKVDTIPFLGTTNVEDDEGYKKTVKKDYEIYITVK
jgi:hypothetical protein